MNEKDNIKNFKKMMYYNVESTKFKIMMVRKNFIKTLCPSQKESFKTLEKLNNLLLNETLSNFNDFICKNDELF